MDILLLGDFLQRVIKLIKSNRKYNLKIPCEEITIFYYLDNICEIEKYIIKECNIKKINYVQVKNYKVKLLDKNAKNLKKDFKRVKEELNKTEFTSPPDFIQFENYIFTKEDYISEINIENKNVIVDIDFGILLSDNYNLIEGLERTISSHIQKKRREIGCRPTDNITISLFCDSDKISIENIEKRIDKKITRLTLLDYENDFIKFYENIFWFNISF